MRIVRLLVLSAVLLLVPASAASAASMSIGFSADPTEDKPVTVTVSSAADTSRSLWVLLTTSSSCASTVAGNAGASTLSDYYGDYVSAGSYTRDYSFTPSDTSTYRICGYLGSSRSTTGDASATNTVTARRTTASAAISFSADPTEDKPVVITVTGETEVARSLWVLQTTASSCASTVQGNAGASTLSDYYGDYLSAGAYTRDYSFTPPDTSVYRFCAYVGQSRSAANDATATNTVTARRTTASAAVSFSADPTEDKPVVVTVSGESEVARSLWVLQTTADSCASTVAGNPDASTLSDYYGDYVPAGPYTRDYSFTPPDTSTYRICAYLGQARNTSSDATATATTTARTTRATVALAGPQAVRVGERVNLTVSGRSEVARSLWVTQVDGACPPAVTGSALSDYYGDYIAPGAYAKSYSFTAAAPGTQSICAWLGQARSAPMDASASLSIATAPAVALAAQAPASNPYGKPVPLALTGSTNKSTFLYAYVLPGAATCPKSPNNVTSGATTAIGGVAQPVGDIRSSASFGPATPGTYKLCAYAAPDQESYYSTVDAAAETTFVIQEDPAFLLVLLGNDDDEDRDRLTLRWRRGPSGTQDTVRVYDQAPRQGLKPVLEAVDSDDSLLDLKDEGDVRVTKVRRFLGYRQLWWQVKRTAAGNRVTYSTVQRLRVVPRPLTKAAALARASRKLGSTSKRPGSVRLSVFSSPLSKVAVRITRRGRAYTSRSWTESVGGVRSVAFPLSCRRTGVFRYTVQMKDPYGTAVTRKGSWSLPASRCATLKRREAAKRTAARNAAARKRAAAERRRQRQSSGSSGSSGGSGGAGGSSGCDGDPGATPYPQFPGQRDGDHDGCYGES